MQGDSLGTLRKSIDEIDAVIVAALGERARLSREIAAAKREGDAPVRDADRESALLGHRSALGERAGLDPGFVRRVYREILDDSVRRQHEGLRTGGDARRPLRIAFQGLPGAYGYEALCRHFAVAEAEVDITGYPSFRRVVEAVVEGEADRGVLPLENTTAGSVHEVYDLLQRFNLSIVGEEVIRVEHCLLGVGGSTPQGLRRVHSHPQALAQCSEFLAGLSACEGTAAANTAVAARLARDLGDPAQGAIASPEAAVHYGLDILARGIANQPGNYTRFAVVGAHPESCDPRIAARVSLVLATRHQHGALARCLDVVAGEGLNLTRLESRPRPGMPWEYIFYLDVEGHVAEPRMQTALARLAALTVFLRVIGCYPARDLPDLAPVAAGPSDSAHPPI